MAYSPGGRYLAAACVNGSIVVWDTWNWSQLPIPHQHTKLVHTLAFSGDERYLASGGADDDVLVWDVITGARLQKLHHAGTVRQVAFGPGNHLATAGGGWSRPALGPGYRTSDSSVRASRGSRAWSGVQRAGACHLGRSEWCGEDLGPDDRQRHGQRPWAGASGHIHGVSRSKRPAGAGRFGRVSGSLGQPGPRRASGSTGTPRMLPAWPSIRTGLPLPRVGGGRSVLKLWDPASGQEALTIEIGDITPIGASRSGSTAVNSPWAVGSTS